MSGLDGIKAKMAALRVEADASSEKAEQLQADVKRLEQENLQKEQEITSLTHRNSMLEAEVEKLETGLKDAKGLADERGQHSSQNESLTRKLQLLEEEAETADKNLREANEKHRSADVKAGHFERKVAALESQNADLEKKFDDLQIEHKKVLKELEDFRAEIEGL